MRRVVGYVREEKDRNSLEAQKNAIEKRARNLGWDLIKIYEDYADSIDPYWYFKQIVKDAKVAKEERERFEAVIIHSLGIMDFSPGSAAQKVFSDLENLNIRLDPVFHP